MARSEEAHRPPSGRVRASDRVAARACALGGASLTVERIALTGYGQADEGAQGRIRWQSGEQDRWRDAAVATRTARTAQS